MKYVKLLIIVPLACLLVLTVLYSFYSKGYERYYSFEHGRMKEIIEGKNSYDILFIGSSRTYYHVNPRIVDSITKLSSFNAGSDAANLLEMNLFLQCYLQSHQAPKVVVADIAKSAFNIGKRKFWNPNVYYPFLDHRIVFDTLARYESVFLYKHLPFTRFTAADDMLKQNSFLGYLGYKSVEKSKTYKGYWEKSTDTIALPFKRVYPIEMDPIDQHGVDLLNQIINTCNKNNIKLVLTYAPIYKLKDEKSPHFFPTIEKVSKQHHIPFWNYRENAIGNNHRLFREEYHLNKQGAEVYTTMLAKDLNSMLNTF
jgi:hypothetical protein